MESRVVLIDVWFIRRIGCLLFCGRLQMRRVRDLYITRGGVLSQMTDHLPRATIRRLTDAPNGALIV